MALEGILTLGFAHIGEWCADAHLKSGIRHRLQQMQTRRVIYAFIVGDQVKYVGVCDNTTTSLHDRMSRYQSMAGAGTNRRIAGYIREVLASGTPVFIYAWEPRDAPQHQGITIDLVKGLENPLIARLRPEWNIKG